MAVRLADGTVARYCALNGEGIARTPHQERPDVTWDALADQFGQDVMSVLRVQAEAADLAHIDGGCALTNAMESCLRTAMGTASRDWAEG